MTGTYLLWVSRLACLLGLSSTLLACSTVYRRGRFATGSRSTDWKGIASFLRSPLRMTSRLAIYALIMAPTVYAVRAFVESSPVRGLENVYVVRTLTPYDYWMRVGQTEFYAKFCADYEPQFSTGQTLRVLNYEDRGGCWSVNNTHPAYLILRDKEGNPIIR